jgi:dihydroxy-acid dehydratase
LVENGDVISIDVKKKVVDLEVPKDQLAERSARLQALPETETPGWLGIYKRVVKPLHEGAVLVD